MPKLFRRLSAALPFEQKGVLRKTGPRGRLHLAFTAALVAASAGGAEAATLQPKAGLDGMLRIAVDTGATLPASRSASFSNSQATAWPSAPRREADPATAAKRLASATDLIAVAAVNDKSGAPATDGPPASIVRASGRNAPADSAMATAAEEAGPPSEASQSSTRGAGSFPAFDLPFGLRSFGGPTPCFWSHPSFGAAEYRDRCGHPATVAQSGPAPSVRFAASVGGGSSSNASAPLVTGPTPPPRTDQPAPVPVPPAWLLLATAVPLLMRRRGRN